MELGMMEPYYTRRFLPSETEEVRVYLHGGNDSVERIGRGGPILVRVIAGGGEDVVDDSRSGGTGSKGKPRRTSAASKAEAN